MALRNLVTSLPNPNPYPDPNPKKPARIRITEHTFLILYSVRQNLEIASPAWSPWLRTHSGESPEYDNRSHGKYIEQRCKKDVRRKQEKPGPDTGAQDPEMD